MELSELVYEDINQHFGWGRFGDIKVLIRKKDGYVNASKLCQQGGKLLGNWNDMKRSQALMEELKGTIENNICAEVYLCGTNQLLSGTYVHPYLVPHISSWISPQFAIKVSQIVNNYFLRQHREEIERQKVELGQKQDKIDELMIQNKEILAKNEQILSELKEASCTIKRMDYRLEVANENIIETLDTLHVVSNERVPIPRMAEKEKEQLILLHIEGELYKAVRAQKRSVNKMIAVQQQKYDRAVTIVARFDSRPNAKELWNAIKRRLRAEGHEVKANELVFRDRDYLLRVFRECNNEKFDAVQGLLNERDLWNENIKRLRQICKERNLKNYSLLRKAELIRLLTQ